MKLLSLLFFTLAVAFLAYADATRVVTTPDGSYTESYTGVRGPARPVGSLDDPVVLWWRNLAAAMFYSTAVSTNGYAYSGSGLNDPREAAQYLIAGDGSPFMALNGRYWEVAASPHGGYWAALDTNVVANTFVLYLLTDSASAVVWTYTLDAGGAAGTDGLQFSEDGTKLALFYSRSPNPPKLLVWDVTVPDSVPLMDYDFTPEQGLYPRAMEVSADGSVIAATADAFCVVIETNGAFVRDVINFEASTDGLALSADGDYVMGGFQSVRMWHWDGTDYLPYWQVGMGGRYCSQLLISPDNSYAVSCWYSSTYNRNYIRVHDMTNGAQIWAYTYFQATGQYQDWPIDVDISADGNWFAVGSWGDQGNSNGEACVFSRWYPTPYYQLDMAGSCWSLDLSSDGRYLVAGGKHVHANQFGNGGDLYTVDLDNATLEPILVAVDTTWIYPDTVCFCQDTALLTPRIANIGFAPFTIEEIVVGVVMEDSSFSAVDSSQIGLVVNPGDTVAIRAWYAPCSVYAGYPSILVSTSVGLAGVPGEVPFDYCTGAQDPLILPPSSFTLSAYPNPFNSSTSLSFSLPSAGHVSLILVDILGREVGTVADRSFAAGHHRIVVNADHLASGIYFARLESNLGFRTQKLMLVR